MRKNDLEWITVPNSTPDRKVVQRTSTALRHLLKGFAMADRDMSHPLVALLDQIYQAAFAQTTAAESLAAIQAVSKLATLLEQLEGDPLQQEGIDGLIRCIREGQNISLMIHAMSVLSRLKVQAAISLFIDVLLASEIDVYESSDRKTFLESDNSLRLRCSAAQALGKLGESQAIVPLMSILNDKSQNYRLRLAAAESLGKLGHEQAVTPLLEIVTDEREKSIYLKESAVKALGMLGDIRAIEPLIDVLESKRGIRDKFNFLKEQIIEAIGRIGRPSPKATDNLIYALQDEAPSIRLAAVEALSEVGDASCIPMLEQLMLDPQDEIACAAVHAIYHLGGEDEIRRLLQRENLPLFLRDELESYIP